MRAGGVVGEARGQVVGGVRGRDGVQPQAGQGACAHGRRVGSWRRQGVLLHL